MKIIKIDGNGWKLMKVDETGWDDWKWMEVDESGQENLEIIPKCCSPLLLLLITPFDWRRQNIGYHEFLQNLGGGDGPRTDFTLCANRKKWKKNYWKLSKPLILSRGPSVPDQKDLVILAKIKKKTFRPFFLQFQSMFWGSRIILEHSNKIMTYKKA